MILMFSVLNLFMIDCSIEILHVHAFHRSPDKNYFLLCLVVKPVLVLVSMQYLHM